MLGVRFSFPNKKRDCGCQNGFGVFFFISAVYIDENERQCLLGGEGEQEEDSLLLMLAQEAAEGRRSHELAWTVTG